MYLIGFELGSSLRLCWLVVGRGGGSDEVVVRGSEEANVRTEVRSIAMRVKYVV